MSDFDFNDASFGLDSCPVDEEEKIFDTSNADEGRNFEELILSASTGDSLMEIVRRLPASNSLTGRGDFLSKLPLQNHFLPTGNAFGRMLKFARSNCGLKTSTTKPYSELKKSDVELFNGAIKSLDNSNLDSLKGRVKFIAMNKVLYTIYSHHFEAIVR